MMFERIQLGNTGLAVSPICLGLERAEAGQLGPLLRRAGDQGVTWWDVARSSSTPAVRDAMRDETRDTLTISAHTVARSHEDMSEAVALRLAALQLDYLDIMFMGPVASLDDLNDQKEAFAALHEASDLGGVRAAGVVSHDPRVIRWVTQHGQADVVMAIWRNGTELPRPKWEAEMESALRLAHESGVGVVLTEFGGAALPDDPFAAARWAVTHPYAQAVRLAPTTADELDLVVRFVRGEISDAETLRSIWRRAA